MNILLAEDQSMLRDALVKLLLLEEKVDTVTQAANGLEAIDLLKNNDYDIAILDIEMPLKTGLDVLEFIRENHIVVKVIVVTTFKRQGYFQRALKNKVDAYVLKDRSIEALMGTIETVLSGGKDYSPELVESFVASDNPLSKQELSILNFIEKGLSNKEIAEQMFLSEGTVRNYISEILSKLNAANRVLAVNIAKDNEWL